jgi:hypothetical protein
VREYKYLYGLYILYASNVMSSIENKIQWIHIIFYNWRG